MGGRYPSLDDILNIYHALQQMCSQHKSASHSDLQQTLGDAVSKNKVRVGLNLLKDEGVIREHRGAKFELLKHNLEDTEITRIAEAYTERGMSDREKLERMMLYAQSGFCRWNVLTKYFETDEELEKCGTCDNCVNPLAERLDVEPPKSRPSKAEEEELLRQIKTRSGDHKVEVGDLVKLPKSGEAQVESISGDNVDVVLPDGEHKTFKAEFVEKAG